MSPSGLLREMRAIRMGSVMHLALRAPFTLCGRQTLSAGRELIIEACLPTAPLQVRCGHCWAALQRELGRLEVRS